MDTTARAPETTPAALVVMIVHGTFPRRPWQQLRRNLRALWARVRRQQLDEAAMWPAPESQPDRRWWFESGSEFERDVVRRSGLDIVFDRFLWSGCNTFADRAEAARSLRAALREAGLKHPGVPQVVLAHSHGGTVAVKALDTRDESRGGGVTPNVRALLTLGTPFVRLAWRWDRTSEDDKHRVALKVASLLPVMLLTLAPIMAYSLSANSDGVVRAAAGVLGVAALMAAWRASLLAATTIIAIVLYLGGWVFLFPLIAGVLGFTLGGVMNAWPATLVPAMTIIIVTSLGGNLFFVPLLGVAFVFLLWGEMPWENPTKRIHRKWVLGLFKTGLRQVEDEPLCLPCPLLALRAPRDEASLVIGLGQVLQGLPNAAAWLFDNRSHRIVWAVLAIGFGLAGSVVFLLRITIAPQETPQWLDFAAFLVLGGILSTGLGQVVKRLPNAAAWLFDTRSHRIVWAVLAAGLWLAGSIVFLLHVAIASRHVPLDLFDGVFFLVIGGLVSTAPLAALVRLALLVAMLAAIGISLTTGREAFMLPAATRVEAEPLPNARASDGVQRAEMDLEILYEARLVGLNHSLYDAGEVRDRIAIWLREQAGSSAPSC
jgi:hypothetical protein